MAELKQKIHADLKAAMRSRDKPRISTLRLIQAAIGQKEVDERIDLDDAQVLAILNKLARQHQDSIGQFEQAGRHDLVAKEALELQLVQSYLPKPLDEAEVSQIIQDVINKSGASSMKDLGKVMGLLKAELQGRADMGKVSALVKAGLS